MNTDILFFSETNSIEKDELTIQGFQIVARLNCDSCIRKNRGLIVYTKIDLEFINVI